MNTTLEFPYFLLKKGGAGPMRPRSTHIMARSLVCRQRRAEASYARAQGCGGAVAGPSGVPSVTRILHGANVCSGRKERAKRSWIRTNDRSLIRTIDKQR